MKEVFCEDCKWYHARYWEEPEEKCIVGDGYFSNYASRRINKWLPVGVPLRKNSGNNCTDYTRAWYKIWRPRHS